MFIARGPMPLRTAHGFGRVRIYKHHTPPELKNSAHTLFGVGVLFPHSK